MGNAVHHLIVDHPSVVSCSSHLSAKLLLNAGTVAPQVDML